MVSINQLGTVVLKLARDAMAANGSRTRCTITLNRLENAPVSQPDQCLVM